MILSQEDLDILTQVRQIRLEHEEIENNRVRGRSMYLEHMLTDDEEAECEAEQKGGVFEDEFDEHRRLQRRSQ